MTVARRGWWDEALPPRVTGPWSVGLTGRGGVRVEEKMKKWETGWGKLKAVVGGAPPLAGTTAVERKPSMLAFSHAPGCQVLSTGGSKLGLARLALGPAALGLPSRAHRRFSEREPCRTGTCSPHASGPLLPAAQGGTRAEMSDEAWCSFPASGALSAGEKQSQASCVCLRAGRTRRKRRYRGRGR